MMHLSEKKGVRVLMHAVKAQLFARIFSFVFSVFLFVLVYSVFSVPGYPVSFFDFVLEYSVSFLLH